MNIVKINQKEVKFKNFWKPGDQIICTRIFRRSNNECFLCGHTPIEWHHVLLNTISNEIVDVEFSCVIDMKKILEKSGSDQKILFFPNILRMLRISTVNMRELPLFWSLMPIHKLLLKCCLNHRILITSKSN